jgi:hypothetical protein
MARMSLSPGLGDYTPTSLAEERGMAAAATQLAAAFD